MTTSLITAFSSEYFSFLTSDSETNSIFLYFQNMSHINFSALIQRKIIKIVMDILLIEKEVGLSDQKILFNNNFGDSLKVSKDLLDHKKGKNSDAFSTISILRFS